MTFTRAPVVVDIYEGRLICVINAQSKDLYGEATYHGSGQRDSPTMITFSYYVIIVPYIFLGLSPET